jgi:hypothetical protein
VTLDNGDDVCQVIIMYGIVKIIVSNDVGDFTGDGADITMVVTVVVVLI